MGSDTQLHVAVRGGGTETVVTVSGELDMCTAAELRECLLRVIHRHGPRLTLDLGCVTFMDCAGINVLLAARRRARLEGGWVHVIRASARVRRLLALLGMERLFAAEDELNVGEAFAASRVSRATLFSWQS
jgi:anti-sigma B factor antagonist